jgi:ubiquitin C-terminal hydrolase
MYEIVPYKGEVQSEPQKYEQKFTGLSNQGATCYMNSLLQSLYMTPELRSQIYNWKYDHKKHGEKKTCIPYQLQVLFGKLQVSKRPNVETKSLTKSFGWDIKESFQQHDVQEFCRVLFDAIEESVKGTECENMISSLYEGVMTDYVKCLECNNESKRTDRFLDLSLTVRNDFEKIKNDSIEKALQNYIKPELLRESNQYMCEICGHKVDASKGLKIEKFPYILVQQIKRFDLNYTTLQRIKLNDRVSFPQILNANCFLGEFKELLNIVSEDLEEEKTISLPEIKFKAPEGVELKEYTTTTYESLIEDRDKKPLPLDKQIKDRIISEQTEKRKKKQQELIETYLKDGEYVYELFSIMIHSGSAMGGHYYAYIKCFEDSKWYNFNDSVVKEIEEKEITKVFGGENSSSSWGSTYSANAYLLMYRKICSENLIRVDDSQLPSYITEEIYQQVEEEKKEASAREEKNLSIHFKVIHDKKEITILTRKDKTLREFKLEAMNKFDIKNRPEDVRLRSYSTVYEVFQEAYDEEKRISALQCWDYKVFGVEIKSPEDEWKLYDPSLITIKVCLWDDVTDPVQIPEPHKCIVSKTSTVKKLLELFEKQFGISESEILVFKKSYMGMSFSCEHINTPRNLEYTLMNARVYEGSLIYIEKKTEDKPKWQEFMEQESRRYTIKFNHPDEPLNNISSPDYKHSVVIDQQATLNDLKVMISKKVRIPVENFLMKRGGMQSQEIKDLSVKLVQANVMNNCVIYIERGIPTTTDQYRILFSLAVPPKETDSKAYCYSFIDLFDAPVDSTVTIFTIKTNLCHKINELYPSMQLDPKKIRLRERNSDRLSKALRNEDTLKNYAIYERKMISLQILQDIESEIPSTHMIILGKKWNSLTWEISEPTEFYVKRNSTVQEIGEILSAHYKIEVIYNQHEKLLVAKLGYGYNFTPLDLLNENFLKTLGQNQSISQGPWYVCMDGVLFL